MENYTACFSVHTISYLFIFLSTAIHKTLYHFSNLTLHNSLMLIYKIFFFFNCAISHTVYSHISLHLIYVIVKSHTPKSLCAPSGTNEHITHYTMLHLTLHSVALHSFCTLHMFIFYLFYFACAVIHRQALTLSSTTKLLFK